MLETKWFQLSAFALAGLIVATTALSCSKPGQANSKPAPAAAQKETDDQQIPAAFIVGDVAQSILDVQAEGDPIGETMKTIAPEIQGYDDIVLQEESGQAFLTGRDGWIWKVDLKTEKAEHFVDVPVMPAGAHQFPGDPDVLIITCSRGGSGTPAKEEKVGLYKLNVATKEVTPLAVRVPKTPGVSAPTVFSGATERRFKLSQLNDANSRDLFVCNDASISADGKRIYFTESYRKPGATMGGLACLAPMIMLGSTGSLWMLDTENQTISQVASGYTFTDGILVEGDGSKPEETVLLTDNFRFQIHRIHVAGDKAGQNEVVWSSLPGLVDGLHRDAEGRIWVSFVSKRGPQLTWIHANPQIKPTLMKHPQLISLPSVTSILVLSSDASTPLWYAEHYQTRVHDIAAITPGKDGVYLANFSEETPGLHRMDNPFDKK